MSYEDVAAEEVPVEKDETSADPARIGRDRGQRITTLPAGTALSVLWWVESEPGPPR